MNRIAVGIKPGSDPSALLELAKTMATPATTFFLVSLLQVGKREEGQLDRLEQTKSEVRALADALEQEGYRTDIEVNFGMVGIGTDLARLADRADADLIVIGMNRRSAVGKALLGSDVQATLLHATCPVLLSRTS